MEEITKESLHKIDYEHAHVECPSCERHQVLHLSTGFGCENPNENHRATGFQVSPFDAPSIVTPASLVIASTSYASLTKFKQFSLGQCAQDADSGFTDEDLEKMGVQMAQTPFTHHFLGLTSACTTPWLLVGWTTKGGSVWCIWSRRTSAGSGIASQPW